MISKEAFRLIVTGTGIRTGMSQEEMAVDMGYGKNYISDMLTPTGKVSEKFVKAFQRHFNNLSSENTKSDPVLLSILQKQNSLMEMQNKLLEEMKTDVKDKVKNIEGKVISLEKDLSGVGSNLSTALDAMDQVSLHVESSRQVALKSLARLEKKTEMTLLDEADSIVEDLMKRNHTDRSKGGAGR